MNRTAAPVVPSADSLVALARALHGVLRPFVVHGSTLVPSTIEARRADGTVCPITPAGDVWQQQSTNEVLRGISPAEINFDLHSTGVLEEVRHALFTHDKGPLRAELVAVDLQEPGPRSEPKLPACDGALMVCLPSRFFGGELVASSRGSVELFRWGNEIESDADPHRVRWAAVGASVRTQVERVRQGCRVVLLYALYREQAAPDRVVDDKAHTDAIRLALRGLRPDLDAGAVLAVPCEGAYSSVDRFIQGSNLIESHEHGALVGRDARLAEAAHAQGLRVRIRPYLLDVRAGESFRMERFIEARRAPLAADERKRALEALTAKLPALPTDRPLEETFVIEPPKFTGIPKRYELDARAPKALFDKLPAIEPAPVAGVVRADSAAAALYIYAALIVDGVGAKETAPLTPSKAAKPPKPTVAKEPAKEPAAAKAPAKAKSAPAKSAPAKSAPVKKKPAAEKPRGRVSATSAVGDFRKGIADVLARIESKSKNKSKSSSKSKS